MGGICPAAVTSLEGCNTSFHPGNQFGSCPLLGGSSLVIFAVASSTGESVCTGWVLLGAASSDCVVKDSSGGPCC